MNPPPPRPPRSSALVLAAAAGSAAGSSAASGVPSAPTAAASAAPYASAPWSPSTRGWLVPTEAQKTGAQLTGAADRQKALALATNRAANAVVLHAAAQPTFTATKRKSATVLEEEEYLDNMSAIIRRDFFPALDAMERKLAMHTPVWDGRLVDSTPAATPRQLKPQQRPARVEGQQPGDETPLTERPESPSGNERDALVSRKSASVAAAAEAEAAAAIKLHPHELRLGSYLELHTSEDNASFEHAQAKRRKITEQKRHWANANFEDKVNDQRIVLRDDPERSGNPSGWKYAVKNKLFFYPDAEGRSELSSDAYDHSLTPSQQVQMALHQKSASIEYENTRFPGMLTNPFPGQNASSNPKADAAAAAAIPAREGNATPAIGGYKLLRTPTIIPGGAGAESPLMTWGAVVATPQHLYEEDVTDRAVAAAGVPSSSIRRRTADALALDPSDTLTVEEATAGLRFKIAPTPNRDAVAWGLAEAAQRREAEKKKRKREERTPVPMGTLTPGRGKISVAPSTPMMSPAAQRLMEKTLRSSVSANARSSGGASRPRSAVTSGFDSQLRASYSPAIHTGAAVSRSFQRPAVPLFNATPSPMHLPITPARVR